MREDKPEINKLENVVADFDYLLQEGVIYNQDELNKIWRLIENLIHFYRELEQSKVNK